MLEWHRVVGELESVGKLHTADRALLTIYCRTWQTWNIVARVVDRDGPIVLLPNNWPGDSAESKKADKLAPMLAKMLDQLGLTSAHREAAEAAPVEDEGISY